MPTAAVQTLRAQIRGVTGALLVVGLTFHYTMETWGWTLPLTYLAGYAFVGLALVVVLTHWVGFREQEGEITQQNPLRYAVSTSPR